MGIKSNETATIDNKLVDQLFHGHFARAPSHVQLKILAKGTRMDHFGGHSTDAVLPSRFLLATLKGKASTDRGKVCQVVTSVLALSPEAIETYATPGAGHL